MSNLGSDLAFAFQEHYVAYLDLLGFRDLIHSASKDDPGSSSQVKTYFQTVLESLSPDSPKSLGIAGEIIGGEPIRHKLISDAIILAVPAKSILELRKLCLYTIILQGKLARKGLWLRGAISRGSFYMEEKTDVTVGPALTEAYLLETKEAKYPRVIIDPRLLVQEGLTRSELNDAMKIDPSVKHSLIADFNSGMFSAQLPSFISFPENDAIMLDYIFWCTKLYRDHRPEFLSDLVGSLRNSIYSKQEVFRKFHWTKQYMLAALWVFGRRTNESIPNNIFETVAAL